MIRRLRIAFTVVLFTCAVVVTGLLVWREWAVRQPIPPRPPISGQTLSPEHWQAVTDNQSFWRSSTAPVRLVLFYDYECEFCYRMRPVVDTVRARYPDSIAIAYRHFPMPYHTGAYNAAIAVECAGNQQRFEPFDSVLYTRWGQLSGSVNWESLAKNAGVSDLERFRECVSTASTSAEISADTAVVSLLSLDGIPALVVNGELYSRLLTTDELDGIVSQFMSDLPQ